RSHIHLHLGECQRRLYKCAVTGCNNTIALGMPLKALNERKKELGALVPVPIVYWRSLTQTRTQAMFERDVTKTGNGFRWTLKLADQTEGKDPASPFFCFERCTFRCIWRRTCTPKKLELGQVISSKPLTVRARFGLIRDGEVDKIFKTRSPESICEGSSFSTEADLGRLTDVQELIIKVIILIYSYE
ncbi:unnamed protein product, partial [Porites lobata]